MSHPRFKYLVYFGRFLAFTLVGLFALFFVAEGGVNPSDLKPVELQMMIALAVCLGGYTLQAAPPYAGGRRAVWGASIGLLGFFAFYLINYLHSGRLPGGPVFPVMFVPGLIELANAFFDSRNSANALEKISTGQPN